MLHLGGALSADIAERARAEQESNPRYRWLGELPRWKALRMLARSRLLVMTSLSEGGPSAVSEALASGVPVISTPVAGVAGLLGESYPGYFPTSDTRALAEMLDRASTDERFYGELQAWCRSRAPLVDPARERRAWECLLEELA